VTYTRGSGPSVGLAGGGRPGGPAVQLLNTYKTDLLSTTAGTEAAYIGEQPLLPRFEIAQRPLDQNEAKTSRDSSDVLRGSCRGDLDSDGYLGPYVVL